MPLDKHETLPSHIGVIMDGNGRWASLRGLPRSSGHAEGLKAAKRLVKACAERGVPFLSIYVFSTENWKRAQDEVGFLMGLIAEHLEREFDFYRAYGVRIFHSGELSSLPGPVRKAISGVVSDTSENKGICLNLAINYGGQDEILRAVKRYLSRENASLDDLDAQDIEANLDQPAFPAPDLIIRSAGERRLSNFLLWGAAYAEFFTSQTLWPDWDTKDLDEALLSFSQRQRLYGGKR